MVDVVGLLAKHFSITDYDGWPTSYQLNSQGEVEVENGDVTLKTPMAQLPVVFDHVASTFEAEDKGLTTLKGVPRTCDSLSISHNRLTSLDYCTENPKWVWASHNQLKNLKGSLRSVEILNVRDNPFETLDGLEKIKVKQIKITYSETLPLLKLLAAQQIELFDNAPNPKSQKVQMVEEILNRYAGQGEAAGLECAVELASHDLKQNARW